MKRDRPVKFPRPHMIDRADEAGQWARLARVVAAELASRGGRDVYATSLANGTLIGILLSIALTEGNDPGLSVLVRALYVGVGAVVLGLVAAGVAWAFSRRGLRQAYAQAPVWALRAEAYERRQEFLIGHGRVDSTWQTGSSPSERSARRVVRSIASRVLSLQGRRP
ncbi:hypothetical protein GCM10010972_00270 [Cellulomonas carbonis]|nr:hypothetical protein GCM10010972_00270 [Cellulomonas carbonis]